MNLTVHRHLVPPLHLCSIMATFLSITCLFLINLNYFIFPVKNILDCMGYKYMCGLKERLMDLCGLPGKPQIFLQTRLLFWILSSGFQIRYINESWVWFGHQVWGRKSSCVKNDSQVHCNTSSCATFIYSAPIFLFPPGNIPSRHYSEVNRDRRFSRQ
jgi:hypothetical protein